MELLARAYGLRRHRLQVTGPLRKPVRAIYYLGSGRAGILDSAIEGKKHKQCGATKDPVRP